MLMLPAPKTTRQLHIVSIGGGITSTLLLPLKVIEKYGRENVRLVMAMLTNDEHSARPLVEAVEKFLGMSVERITPQPDFKDWRHVPAEAWALYDIWDIFNHTGRMGSTLADPCSRILKRETLAAYMTAFPGAILHVGITADEIDRMMAIKRNWTARGVKVEADLCDVPNLTRETAIAECQRLLGFVPDAYKAGMSHNNCGGGCVKAGHGQMARFLYYNRAEFLRWETNELAHQQRFNHTSTIMVDRKQSGGVLDKTPLTLRAFRERLETRWAGLLPGFDPFDGLDETPGCKWCEAA